ncbi:hypothetical protein M427DRAFT_150770 [Gonapodya prolifera JEL478]|uniref:Transcription factor domain-containing protein n=1 Tax=Gonapodya prolifera (strain JEL478) TaxID=1344416 RepID=A0A139B0N8_GONPJ|nr:hypothetical protein M427DRAFT_150770 [Gonapodya prolifera JEL478]|eukprot:KXS22510.1 hypothetical protein M427DRAFT_150770 [Gonapodya prolifera JEL478]
MPKEKHKRNTSPKKERPTDILNRLESALKAGISEHRHGVVSARPKLAATCLAARGNRPEVHRRGVIGACSALPLPDGPLHPSHNAGNMLDLTALDVYQVPLPELMSTPYDHGPPARFLTLPADLIFLVDNINSSYAFLTRQLSPFDDLPPLPDVADCNHLITLYFEGIGKWGFVHRDRFFRKWRYRNAPLALSMLTLASSSQTSPTFHHLHHRSLLKRLVAFLPHIVSPPHTLDKLHTLCHLAEIAHKGTDMRPLEWILERCVVAMIALDAAIPDPDRRSASGMSASTKAKARAQTDKTVPLDRWIYFEEARRASWFVGLVDTVVVAWTLRCPNPTLHASLARLSLPSHELAWSTATAGSSSEHEHSPLSFPDTHPIRHLAAVAIARKMPSLEQFFDPVSWRMDLTPEFAVGALALSTMLQVHCFGRVLEYRAHCSQWKIHAASMLSETDNGFGALADRNVVKAIELNNTTAQVMRTWYDRFHSSFGLSVPRSSCESVGVPQSAPLEQLPHCITGSPCIYALLIQYYCLAVFWNGPIPPDDRDTGSPSGTSFQKTATELSKSWETGTDTPSFVEAWVRSPAFVTCLDLSHAAIAALGDFLNRHGPDALSTSTSPTWGFFLSLSAIPPLIAAKEAVRGLDQSADPNAYAAVVQLLQQTKEQVGIITTALNALSSSVAPTRGRVAALMIERLFSNIISPSGIDGSRMIDWVAQKGSAVLWQVTRQSAESTLATASPASTSVRTQEGQEGDFVRIVGEMNNHVVESGVEVVVDRGLMVCG